MIEAFLPRLNASDDVVAQAAQGDAFNVPGSGVGRIDGDHAIGELDGQHVLVLAATPEALECNRVCRVDVPRIFNQRLDEGRAGGGFPVLVIEVLGQLLVCDPQEVTAAGETARKAARGQELLLRLPKVIEALPLVRLGVAQSAKALRKMLQRGPVQLVELRQSRNTEKTSSSSIAFSFVVRSSAERRRENRP